MCQPVVRKWRLAGTGRRVVVVGGGPVGAAAWPMRLARYGVPSVVLSPATQSLGSHATCISRRSCWDGSVVERVLAKGVALEPAAASGTSRQVLEFAMPADADQKHPQ